MRTLLFGTVLLLVSAFAADRDLTGPFAGEWKSGSSGNGGAIHFTLREGGASDIGFTLDGAEVPCKTVTFKLQDGKILLAYDFEAQGYTLRSTLKGEWKDGAFSGTYDTGLGDGSQGVDAGSWTAKRKP